MDVSVIVPLRDQEHEVAAMIRAAAEIPAYVRMPEGMHAEITLEILALDERSGDNTLSVLSVLHGQIPGLRTVQDIDPGFALRRASKIARGRVWLLLDHPIAAEAAGWALGEVLRGARAAVVPGEVLAAEGQVGARLFSECRGGLVAAQHQVMRFLKKRGEDAVVGPVTHSAGKRMRLFLRRGCVRLGLGRFDRPSR